MEIRADKTSRVDRILDILREMLWLTKKINLKKGNEKLILDNKDKAIKIPKNNLTILFEKFLRRHNVNLKKYGTILVFSMVTDIVELHEDNPSLRKLLKYNLKRTGFLVDTAENCKEVISNLDDTISDLIVCDIMMPVMDVFDLRSKIIQYPKLSSIPFIFLTTKDQNAFKIRGKELRVENYLTKPFLPKQLVEKIQAVINTHNSKKV